MILTVLVIWLCDVIVIIALCTMYILHSFVGESLPCVRFLVGMNAVGGVDREVVSHAVSLDTFVPKRESYLLTKMCRCDHDQLLLNSYSKLSNFLSSLKKKINIDKSITCSDTCPNPIEIYPLTKAVVTAENFGGKYL